MQQFFGYIRVSTAKQGVHGVSLQEQRDAIVRYAERNRLTVASWFEERETAAKRGRPVFGEMLRLLRQRKAGGVLMHKIDRSARNLKDWAELGELVEQGIEVYFANESLDLHTRGGRLSADIQAVVAADYIRNLREETRKGFYGRIKQGLYPLPAPVGYLDRGKGKVKEIDPIKGPLVRKAFDLYGTGRHNVETLGEELWRLGLRNTRGGRITRTGLSMLLHNPFYIGLIKLRRTGETFPGAHEPLIPKSLFDRVADIARGKFNARTQRYDFLFRRMLTCAHCGYSLIGERQKGHTYYRCHTANCATKAMREEAVEKAVTEAFAKLHFDEREKAYLRTKIASLRKEWAAQQQTDINALNLRMGQFQDRLGRLTDAFIDGSIDKALFEERKASLLLDRKATEEKLTAMKAGTLSFPDWLEKNLEPAGAAYFLYKSALPDEKRDLVKITTSNRRVDGKKLDLTLAQPFHEIAKRFENTIGAPYRDRPRTLDRLLRKLQEWFRANHTDATSTAFSLPFHRNRGKTEEKADGFAA